MTTATMTTMMMVMVIIYLSVSVKAPRHSFKTIRLSWNKLVVEPVRRF